MDFLDAVKSVLDSGKGEGSGKTDILSIVTGLIGGQGGAGLSGIVKQFTEKGLGDVVSSWVGKGENAPVSPEEVKNVFGDDSIDEIASKTGLDKKEVTGQLSDILPQVVDKLTPDGKIPESNESGIDLGQIGNLLDDLFGKKQ